MPPRKNKTLDINTIPQVIPDSTKDLPKIVIEEDENIVTPDVKLPEETVIEEPENVKMDYVEEDNFDKATFEKLIINQPVMGNKRVSKKQKEVTKKTEKSKQALIEKIQRYKAGYEVFKNLVIPDNPSQDELDSIMRHINVTLNSSGGAEMIRVGYGFSLKAWEGLSQKAGIKSQGLHDTIMKPNSAWEQPLNKIFKQLSCEYGSVSSMPPIVQLGAITLMATGHIHSRNTEAEKLQEFLNVKVKDDSIIDLAKEL